MSIRTLGRPLALLLCAALVTTGCVKLKETNTLNADGSGRAKVVFTIDMEMANQLKEMLGGMGQDTAEMDVEGMFDEEKVRQRLDGKDGIKVIGLSTVKDDENLKLTHTLEIEFTSLEALYKSGAVEKMSVSVEKSGDDYVWTRIWGGEDLPEGEEAEAQLQGILMMFETFMAEMEVSTTITFPTRVIETNGVQDSDNQVTWTMKFNDLGKRAKMEQVAKFSGEGVTIAPFTVSAADMEQARAETADAPGSPVTPSDKPPEQPQEPPKEPSMPGGDR